jgi:ribose transport system permease protein
VPLPPIVVLWLLLAALLALAERGTLFGRYLFASGANERAARLALVPVAAIRVGTFALSAVCAAVAGILLAGFSGGADASVGQPYLFQTVAAVVVGGTSLLGGSGGYARTVAGALLITLLTTLLIGLGFDDRLQQLLLGALIVALVGAYGREPHVRTQI